MGEEAAAVEAPAPSVAATPPAARPSNESFQEAFSRHLEAQGVVLPDDDEADAGDAPASEAKPPAAPATNGKEPPVPAAADRDQKLEQLKALATDLGLVIDDQRVSVDERVAWRKAKQKRDAAFGEERAAFQKQMAEEREKFDKERSGYEERVKRADTILHAIDNAKDYDDIAAALGHKDWNALMEDSVARFSDPNYKELKELKRWQAEQLEKETRAQKEAREKEERAAKEAAEKERVTKQNAVRQAHLQGISAQMKASTESAVREFAEDPALVNAIFAIQRENYDKDTDSTVTVAQALKMPLKDGKSLLQILRENQSKLIERATRAFGDDIIPEEVRKKLGMPKEQTKKNKTSTSPVNPTAAASEPVQGFDEGAFRRRFRSEMASAIANDDKKPRAFGRR